MTRALIVDDDEDIRDLLAEIFTLEGYIVSQAESGRGALAMFKADPVDVVVTDVRMPNGSGVELLKSLRSLEGHNPLIVMITGWSEFTESQLVGMGADAVYYKPFETDHMLAKIGELLRGRA